MRVCVLSDDPRAACLIRNASLAVDSAPVRGAVPDADVIIWDPHRIEDLPAELPARPQIVLLREADVVAFHKRHPGCVARVLLKPVEPEALDAAISCAILNSGGDLLHWLLAASWKVQQHGTERINFLTRTLHEVGAPLSAACGYCGLLADKCLGPLSPRQAETIERMERSLQRISALASAAFQLSIGGTEIAAAAMQAASLEDCVEQAMYEVAPSAEARQIGLTIRMGEQPEGVRFDSTQMVQVFVNLLDNACRFAERNSIVVVSGYPVSRRVSEWIPAAVPEATGYRVDVCDSGPGIPPDRRSLIFQEHVSYSGAGDRAGTGLGLAICRLIMEAHGGEAFADSRPDGATFSVILPAQAEAEGTARAPVLPIAGSPKFQVSQ